MGRPRLQHRDQGNVLLPNVSQIGEDPQSVATGGIVRFGGLQIMRERADRAQVVITRGGGKHLGCRFLPEPAARGNAPRPVPDTCRYLVCKADCDRRQREPDGGGQCSSDLVGIEIHWMSFAIGRMLHCLEMCEATSPRPLTQVIICCSLQSKS